MAITNKEINLSQLDAELGNQGLIADLTDPENKIIKPADNSKITEAKLEAAIKTHIAVDQLAIKATAKSVLLEKLGITADEAKLLLS